ncbi:MAG: carboxymuconolactone decarboxylase family protein, partial [Candidatus Binataceae bacterium]
GREQGIRDDQLEELAEFESSSRFSAQEKAVLRLSEAMTATPVNVSDEVFEAIRGYFDDAQIVELVAAIALENFRARFNRALAVESEGFCELPPNHPVRLALQGD